MVSATEIRERTMNPSQLFSAPVEPEFAVWLRRFSSVEELFEAREQLFTKLTSQRMDGKTEEGVILVGPAHISCGSSVQSGAILAGPVIIGPNSIIEYGAKILGPTFIGTDVRVRSGTILSNCLLMNYSDIAEGCVFQNCIIGAAVTASAGCIVGERDRKDEKLPTCVGDHVHLGLGCIVSSGSIVLPQQRVPAGTVINR